MSSKEDYLDSLLKTVSEGEPSNGTALHKLAEIHGEENNTATEDSTGTFGNSDDDLDLDFPELEKLFREEDEPDPGETAADKTETLEEVSLSDGQNMSVSETVMDAGNIMDPGNIADAGSITDVGDIADIQTIADDLETLTSENAPEMVTEAVPVPETETTFQTESEIQTEAASDGEVDHLGLSDMDIADLEALMQDDLFAEKDAGQNDPGAGKDAAQQTIPQTQEKPAEQTAPLDDVDVTELIDALNGDADLSEISELLKKSDNHEMIDDDMQQLMETLAAGNGELPKDSDQADAQQTGTEGEETEENTSGKKAKKEKKLLKFGKKKKAKKEKASEEGQSGDTDHPDDASEKQPGPLKRFFAFLTEDDEAQDIGDEIGQIGLSQENIAILESLDKETPKAGKKAKKEKKEKLKKERKEKKEKKKQEKQEKKKEKKPKKEKKSKQKNENENEQPKEPEKPLKPIGKRKIAAAAFLGLTAFGVIMLFTSYIPEFTERRESKKAFEEGNYKEVYDLLVTKNVKGSEEERLKGAMLCLEMERKKESYENYKKIGGMELEQLNALITGVDKYQKIEPQAQRYGVSDEVNNAYLDILGILKSEYGVSEEQAKELCLITDDVDYTKELKRILGMETGLPEEDDAGGMTE